MALELKDFITGGGILLGFEVTAFAWRISEEARIAREEHDIVWLTPSDYLNLLAMLTTSIGVFVFPALEIENIKIFKILFGLASILFVGHAFSLAGHYQLYGKGKQRSFKFFPLQEKISFFTVLAICSAYLFYALKIN